MEDLDLEQIKSHLYLHAVMPQIEEIVCVDKESQKLIGNWQNSIQFDTILGPGICIKTVDGSIVTSRDRVGIPTLGLMFFKVSDIVKMFEGGRIKPIPWIGIWRIDLIKGLSFLSGRLKYYLSTSREELCKRNYLDAAMGIRLGVVVYAVQVLSETWEKAIKIASIADEGVASIRFRGGITFQIISKEGKFKVHRNEVIPPNAIMEIRNSLYAYDLLSGNIDFWTAVGDGVVLLKGNLRLLDPIFDIFRHVGRFLKV